jgi:hypothetical protein
MNRFWDSILRGVTEAAQPRCIVEIGVAGGLLTAKLLDYCEAAGAVLHAIDPQPQIDVDAWRRRHGERLVFHRALSLDVLDGIHQVDAVFIDGDHNWFTVYHELKQLEGTASRDEVLPPLIALHDLDWPYGRRDLYYDPDRIPSDHRQAHRMAGLVPGEPELVADGMNSNLNNAVSEGSLRNGVRTAFEDFVAESELEWELFHIPGFHGLGVAATKDRLAANEGLHRAVKALRTARFLESWAQELELARVQVEIDAERRLSAEHDRHAVSMATVQDRLEERDALGERLVDAERRLAGVPDLELRIADLERDLEEANAAAERARIEAQALDERLTQGQRVLNDVFSSPSWRLTQPLRTAKNRLSRG